MRLLIVDKTAEGQARCARRIEAFNQSDVEMLDLRVKLVLDRDYASHVADADVLILGSGLGDQAPQIARTVLSQMPWLHIVMFVTDEAYSGGAFRAAHAAGVRKVLADSAAPLDLLQELVAIFTEFRREGRIREGRVICVTHVKGGTGATSVCAALGHVCSFYKRKAMLWDLDVETKDLSRALAASGGGVEGKVVNSWVNGSREITRESLSDALVGLSEDVSLLMPPEGLAEAMDLVCHTDGIEICRRIVELGRVMHDVLLIDTGGRIGPATGALLHLADEVLVVIDDTVLGLTGLDLFLTYAKHSLVGADRISFVVNMYTGSLLGVSQMAAELEPAHQLGDRPWRLPPIPVDSKAANWAGKWQTLYTLGQRSTRAALEEIADGLGIIVRGADVADVRRRGSFWERLLPRGGAE